jgi:predicted NAD-dependent protein-ADP-ribosyltransferase YbiA (DUF1768 family)
MGGIDKVRRNAGLRARLFATGEMVLVEARDLGDWMQRGERDFAGGE